MKNGEKIMKIFEQKQEDGSRKLMGTLTNDVANAEEVTLKGSDDSETTFDFTKKYHYVAPGSFAETKELAESEEEVVYNMYIGDTRVVPPNPPYEETSTEEPKTEEPPTEEPKTQENN